MGHIERGECHIRVVEGKEQLCDLEHSYPKELMNDADAAATESECVRMDDSSARWDIADVVY